MSNDNKLPSPSVTQEGSGYLSRCGDSGSHSTVSRRAWSRKVGGTMALLPVVQLAACAEERVEPKVPPAAGEPTSPRTPKVAAEPVLDSAGTTATDAAAEALPRLELSDPAAAALGYVHNESDVDTDRFANFENGQNCGNCTLYTGPKDSEWGPCQIFPGKSVSVVGWCAGYVAAT